MMTSNLTNFDKWLFALLPVAIAWNRFWHWWFKRQDARRAAKRDEENRRYRVGSL